MVHKNFIRTYKRPVLTTGKGQTSGRNYIIIDNWKITHFSDMYYKRPQDVQTFDRNDWNNWKTSIPLAVTKRDGNILRVCPPGGEKCKKRLPATNVHLKRSVGLENVYSPGAN